MVYPSDANGLYNICGPLELLHHNGSNPSDPTSGSNPVGSMTYFQHEPLNPKVRAVLILTCLME
jgi:hypothetical protein